MKITFNVTTVIIIMIAIGAFFFLGKCSVQPDVDRLTVELGNANKTIVADSFKLDSVTQYSFTQSLIIINNNKAINYLEGERERLKALHIKDVAAIGNLSVEIARLNAILSTPTDPVIITLPGDVDSTKYLKLPQEYKINDQWGWATATINFPKSTISYGIHNLPLHVTIGEQGQGFLKKKKSVVVIDTPNPFVTIKKSDIILVEPKKAFYQRPVVWVGVGFVLGSLVL